MKISPISINTFFQPKIAYKNQAIPTFKSQLEQDVFVRTICPVEEKKESKSSLPKYLYHLTNKTSYEKIVNTGKIKSSKDIIDGVFMIDMDDFQTNWRNMPNYNNTGTMAQSLLEQALKGEKGLVLLRIPTEALDETQLVLRPEDDVVNFINSEHFRNLVTAFAEKGGIYNNKSEMPKELVEGYSPMRAQEFSDENRAVEYIYKGNIDVEKVGVEKVLELPMIRRNTLWGYSKKEFEKLYEAICDSASA